MYKAIQIYHKKAAKQNVFACHNLGRCYNNGFGVEKNYASSLKVIGREGIDDTSDAGLRRY